MKGIAKPSIYFSAYPLKAIEPQGSTSNDSTKKSPYLRSLLAGKEKTATRARVFPMINPYKEKDARPVSTISPIDRILSRVPKAEETTEKQWFHNYE
jgi:hypothetical protein